MELKFSFPYKKLSGIIKLKLNVLGKNNLSKFWIVINGEEFPLAVDLGYILNNGFVEFGVNTHRIQGDSVEFIIRLETSLGEMIYSNALKCQISNDKNITNFLKTDISKFPKLFGLPIDSKDFRLRSDKSVFPSPYLQENKSNVSMTSYLNDFDKQGWIVVKGLLSENLVDEAAKQLDSVCASGYMGYVEGESKRLEHLHLREGAIKSLFDSFSIKDFLIEIYGAEMMPCQTLSYRYGSQQAVHSDFVHLTAFPENLMCGVWIALEDVRPGSGELIVYSGTQKLPRLTSADVGGIKVQRGDYSELGTALQDKWEKFIEEGNFQKSIMQVKKGDIIIWDGNLLHAGGQRINTDLTRKSVVLHYFGKGAYSYFDALGDIGISSELL